MKIVIEAKLLQLFADRRKVKITLNRSSQLCIVGIIIIIVNLEIQK